MNWYYSSTIILHILIIASIGVLLYFILRQPKELSRRVLAFFMSTMVFLFFTYLVITLLQQYYIDYIDVWITPYKVTRVIALVLFVTSILIVLRYIKKDIKLSELFRIGSSSSEKITKQLEQEKRVAAQLRHYLNIISHDFQTPTTTIAGFVDLIREDFAVLMAETPELATLFYYIENSAQKLHQLIDGLLDFSRIVNKREFSIEPIDLNVTVQETIDMYSRKITEENIVINAGNLPTIKGNKSNIERVFQHVLDNAIKYRRVGTPLIVDIQSDDYDDKYLISVSDNGIGFRQVREQEVFELFKQLDKETSGAGIGMAIAQEIIQAHGGTMWAQGIENRGATFYFTFGK